MKSPEDDDLRWIAREALKAPLPEHWKPCKTNDGEIYYFNFASGESVWDHPCDEYYKKLYEEEKNKKALGGTQKQRKDAGGLRDAARDAPPSPASLPPSLRRSSSSMSRRSMTQSVHRG